MQYKTLATAVYRNTYLDALLEGELIGEAVLVVLLGVVLLVHQRAQDRFGQVVDQLDGVRNDVVLVVLDDVCKQ